MYGLLKIANEQEQTPVANTALVAGGAGALAASHDRLLGRKKRFYATTSEDAARIKSEGFHPAADPLQAKHLKGKAEAVRSANYKSDPVLRTVGNMEDVANARYWENMDAVSDGLDAHNGKQYPFEVYESMMQEDPTLRQSMKNADQLGNYSDALSESYNRRLDFIEKSKRLLPEAGVVKMSLPYDIDPGAYVQKRPEYIVGEAGNGISRLRESLRNLPDYAANHKVRFGTGAALAGAGLGSIGLGLHRSHAQHEEE